MVKKEPKLFARLQKVEIENLTRLIGVGAKISANKALRDVYGFGLKEAKEIVDYLANTVDWEAHHRKKCDD